MLAPKIEARMLQDLAIRNTDWCSRSAAAAAIWPLCSRRKPSSSMFVEIDPELVELARRNLQKPPGGQCQRRYRMALADLYAPYDVIVVSGLMPALPESLLRQLKVGGAQEAHRRRAAVDGSATGRVAPTRNAQHAQFV